MSEMLGYQHGAQFTNDNISRDNNLQQTIADSNTSRLDESKLKNQLQNKLYSAAEKGADNLQKSSALGKAKDEAGEFLANARNVYKVGKAVSKNVGEVNNAMKSYKAGSLAAKGGSGLYDMAGATGSAASDFNKALGVTAGKGLKQAVKGGTGLYDMGGADINAVLDFNKAIGVTAGKGLSNFTDTVKAGAQAVKDTATAGSVGEAVSGATKVYSSATKTLGVLDAVGKSAEGLNVVSAGSDILDDAEGGFSKLNKAEKVGNVAGITSGVFSAGTLAGSLEAGGELLDATGIGAEIGLGLNIAGAVAGGVSAVADYIGGEKKQKTQIAKPTAAPTPTQQQAPAKVSALQSGGVAVGGYS